MITFINMLSQMAPYLLLGFLMAVCCMSSCQRISLSVISRKRILNRYYSPD